MYIKAFQSMLDSSIWAESAEVCKVWVTILLMSNQDGMVYAAAPGIANRAQVPLDATLKALESFQSPDPHSRTLDHEGRRIERVDGGYMVLNYLKYREMKDDDTRRAQWRESSKKYYENKKASALLSKPQQPSAQVEEEVEAEEEAKKKEKTLVNTPSGRSTNGIPFKEIVEAYNNLLGYALPKVERLTESRKNKIRLRHKELGGLVAWTKLFEEITKSSFLMGESGSWRASLDWIVRNEENPIKILEGRYRNKPDPNTPPTQDYEKSNAPTL